MASNFGSKGSTATAEIVKVEFFGRTYRKRTFKAMRWAAFVQREGETPQICLHRTEQAAIDWTIYQRDNFDYLIGIVSKGTV